MSPDLLGKAKIINTYADAVAGIEQFLKLAYHRATIMKRFIFCSLLTSSFFSIAAQQKGILKNQKDAGGIECTYVGQTSNGKPDGWGMAFYPGSSPVLKYVGQFYEGLYSGKGVMFFRDGEFHSGQWHKGRLYGKCAVRFAVEHLYVGEMAGTRRNGKGTFIFNDNSFYFGHFANDTLVGHVIFLNAKGERVQLQLGVIK